MSTSQNRIEQLVAELLRGVPTDPHAQFFLILQRARGCHRLEMTMEGRSTHTSDYGQIVNPYHLGKAGLQVVYCRDQPVVVPRSHDCVQKLLSDRTGAQPIQKLA